MKFLLFAMTFATEEMFAISINEYFLNILHYILIMLFS